jgi:nucleoside-diphosphate-sugar epimerase
MLKRVLVTGSTGYIGRWSVPALLARGYEVHAVGSREAGAGTPLPAELDGAAYHAADLFDPPAVAALADRVRATHLLHFAWNATPGVYWTTPENFRWVSASLALLESFRRAGGERAVMAGRLAEDAGKLWPAGKTRHRLGADLLPVRAL